MAKASSKSVIDKMYVALRKCGYGKKNFIPAKSNTLKIFYASLTQEELETDMVRWIKSIESELSVWDNIEPLVESKLGISSQPIPGSPFTWEMYDEELVQLDAKVAKRLDK